MRIRIVMTACTIGAALAFGAAALAQPPHHRGMPGDMGGGGMGDGGMGGMPGMHQGMGMGRGGDDRRRKYGARFKFERGDSEIDIRCPADESLQNCVEAAMRLIDRVMGEKQQTARQADGAQRQGGSDGRDRRGYDGERGADRSF